MEALINDPKVWIANYAGQHDYNKARSFGELKRLTVGYISFKSIDRIKFQIANELTQTNKEDYLLISGAAIICVISAVIWFKMHKQLKILYHDKSEDVYRQLVITDGNLDELISVLTHDS
jgi:hypothetical protein